MAVLRRWRQNAEKYKVILRYIELEASLHPTALRDHFGACLESVDNILSPFWASI